jgi:RND family efflux transporter MFP subunit
MPENRLSGWCLSLAALPFTLSLWAAETQERMVVPAALVQREQLSQEAKFDTELRPFLEIEMHARITGYLDSISVDAGDPVKENQVLAVLDQPELKLDLEHAEAVERRSAAEVERAQAVYEDANLSWTRMASVIKSQPNLIAQQDLDAARAKERAAAASLDAAKEQQKVAAAETKKLRVMESFTKITAPFTGIVTKRYSDPGALIQSGTSSGSMPLVRLSQNDKLRAIFPVSVSFVANIKIGDPVQIRIDALKRVIKGKVARFSRKVDTSTRHMDVEVDVDNPDLSITPGMYATAVLTELRPNALSVPVEAVAESNGTMSIYLISKDGKVEEHPVKVGLATATRLEILEGIKEGDVVFTGSRSVVRPGEMVEPKIAETEKSGTPAVAGASR